MEDFTQYTSEKTEQLPVLIPVKHKQIEFDLSWIDIGIKIIRFKNDSLLCDLSDYALADFVSTTQEPPEIKNSSFDDYENYINQRDEYIKKFL